MKNVVWSVGEEQIQRIHDSCRTAFFREKFRKDPWLSGIIRRVSGRPHAFAEQTHDVERLHFSTFWNVWVFHEHENPFIYDLGVLHEILHTLAFQKKREWSTSPERWSRGALARMEKAVSLRTEVAVYQRWPELRNKTFELPIWADKVASWSWKDIKEERQRLLDAGEKAVQFSDPEENRIAKYAGMNARWNVAWAEYGPFIERAWERAYFSTSVEEETQCFEILWENDAKEGVPFRALADRFGNNQKKLPALL